MSGILEVSKLWNERKTLATTRRDAVDVHVAKLNAINSKLDALLQPEVMSVDVVPVFNVYPDPNLDMTTSGLFVVNQDALPFEDSKIELLYKISLQRGGCRIHPKERPPNFVCQGKVFAPSKYFELDRTNLPTDVLKCTRLISEIGLVENLKQDLEKSLTKQGFDTIVESLIGPSVLYETNRSERVPVPTTKFRIHFMSTKGF
jgi:hypothetical protein